MLNIVIKFEYGMCYFILVDWMKEVEKIDDFIVCIYLVKFFVGDFEMLVDFLLIYLYEYFVVNGLEGMVWNLVGIGFYWLVE